MSGVNISERSVPDQAASTGNQTIKNSQEERTLRDIVNTANRQDDNGNKIDKGHSSLISIKRCVQNSPLKNSSPSNRSHNPLNKVNVKSVLKFSKKILSIISSQGLDEKAYVYNASHFDFDESASAFSSFTTLMEDKVNKQLSKELFDENTPPQKRSNDDYSSMAKRNKLQSPSKNKNLQRSAKENFPTEASESKIDKYVPKDLGTHAVNDWNSFFSNVSNMLPCSPQNMNVDNSKGDSKITMITPENSPRKTPPATCSPIFSPCELLKTGDGWPIDVLMYTPEANKTDIQNKSFNFPSTEDLKQVSKVWDQIKSRENSTLDIPSTCESKDRATSTSYKTEASALPMETFNNGWSCSVASINFHDYTSRETSVQAQKENNDPAASSLKSLLTSHDRKPRQESNRKLESECVPSSSSSSRISNQDYLAYINTPSCSKSDVHFRNLGSFRSRNKGERYSQSNSR